MSYMMRTGIVNSEHQPAICQPSVRLGRTQAPRVSLCQVGPRNVGRSCSMSSAVSSACLTVAHLQLPPPHCRLRYDWWSPSQ